MEIGAKLRKLRDKRGLTLEDVASRAKMSAGQISRLELETRNLDFYDYVKLCGIYEVLPGDLLPHSGSSPEYLLAIEPLAEMLATLPERSREAMIHSFRLQLQTVGPVLRETAGRESITSGTPSKEAGRDEAKIGRPVRVKRRR